MNEVNGNKLDLKGMKKSKRATYDELSHTQVGRSKTPKETETRLDMKVMKARRGLGYEQLENKIVGELEVNLKNSMKAQRSSFTEVPRTLDRKHPYA